MSSNESESRKTEESTEPTPELTCAECGGVIESDDLVCPHCGISLVAG
jgi:rubrerythrin